MLPYETEFTVTTSVDNQIVPLKYPGRCVLERIAVYRVGNGAIALTLFNRFFTGPVVNLGLILANGTVCQLRTATPLEVKAGDVVTVAGNTVAGYNTAHRITSVIDSKTFITDQSYTADGFNGNVQLTIPTAEQLLYLVLTLTGTDNAEVEPAKPYVNLDQVFIRNVGTPRLLYAKFGNAGTYKIAIRAAVAAVGTA